MGYAEREDLKLYTDKGVLVCDDDLQDEEWIKDQTVIMATNPPAFLRNHSRSVTPLPAMPSLSRCYTDDTLSLVSSNGVSSPSNGVSSPESAVFGDIDSETSKPVMVSVKLPQFSLPLNRELKMTADKPCPVEAWKRVRNFPQNYRKMPMKFAPMQFQQDL